ncbi:MAG: ATP-binding protein [Oscillospiraceae bacterium]|jgi:signal transduction histidine kinase|nr:ATP-binding protein [Oscillospiraceae bacterium]
MKCWSRGKICISIALGLLCYVLSYAPVKIDSAYDLYLLPGLLLPAAVALGFGMKYAFLCCVPGLAMFCPMVTVPADGWGSFVTSMFLLLWAVGLGYCRDRVQKGLPFLSIYLYQAGFTVLYLQLNRPLVKQVVPYNPPFWYTSYAFSYLPDNLINANAVIIAETCFICIAVMNSVVELPRVKQLLGVERNGFEKNNTVVVLLTGAAALAAALLSTDGITNGMMSITFTVNVYQSTIGTTQFALLKAAAVLTAGDCLRHYLEYHTAQEQRQQRLAFSLQAVFEASEKLIWFIDVRTEKILVCNTNGSEYYASKSCDVSGQLFFDMFSDEDAVLWHDFFDTAQKEGQADVEYYDMAVRQYYRVQIYCLKLSEGKYDFAVFAKNITEEIQMEEHTQKLNEELEIKVLERTQEMRSAYNEMEKMCYVIAHEFKSPVRAIHLYNDAILQEMAGALTPKAQEAAEKIKMYCEKSLDMISEFLQYSKIKSSRLKLVRVSMNKLVENVMTELCMVNSGQDIRLQMQRLPNVMGDEVLLRCCIYNILSNAIKYSSKNTYTEITVSYADRKDDFVFYFRDNGAGFDMKYAQNIFKMFGRMHKDSEFEGNGVGLVAVKNIIEKHGGHLAITAEVDAGCMVSFTLPK